MNTVRAERSGWRDLALSQRHRTWGWDCPCLDIDFLFLEYDRGQATAIVEYKHERAQPVSLLHPSYRAIADLGSRAQLPVLSCRYAADFSWWRPCPLNAHASLWVQHAGIRALRDGMGAPALPDAWV